MPKQEVFYICSFCNDRFSKKEQIIKNHERDFHFWELEEKKIINMQETIEAYNNSKTSREERGWAQLFYCIENDFGLKCIFEEAKKRTPMCENLCI